MALRVSRRLDMPGVFGLWRPVILIPERLLGTLDAEAWRHILRHEFGHVRRRDVLWQAWAALTVSLHWFNPVVWWVQRRMQADRELACDALVLRHRGSSECLEYGETHHFPAATSPRSSSSPFSSHNVRIPSLVHPPPGIPVALSGRRTAKATSPGGTRRRTNRPASSVRAPSRLRIGRPGRNGQ